MEAFLVDAVRTPFGKKEGSLSQVPPDELLAHCLKGLLERNNLKGEEIEDVILGCVTQVGEQGFNLARHGVIRAGLPDSVCGVTINRLCGSSLQAIGFAVQAIRSGDFSLLIAGGVESMSRVPMGSDLGENWEKNLERYGMVSQGVAADRIAQHWGITREELDRFSLESHQKAIAAQEKGYFQKEILPLRGVEKDEGPRKNTSLEKLASLTPVFLPEEEGGLHTAGSSSQISDGASCLLFASEEKVREYSLRPLARMVAFAVTAESPSWMLTGAVPATKKVLKKAKLTTEEIDLFEVNEAFAAIPLMWMKELKVPPSKVNVNGGAIALGHPLGATGARLVTSLIYELERQEKKRGLVTMCIGGGQGIASIWELV